MYSQKNNVTYIDDLPDLEELESRDFQNQFPQQKENHRGNIPEKFRKFIRTSMGTPPDQSGMNTYQQPYKEREFFHPPEQFQNDNFTHKPLNETPSCLDIHSHVSHCPICSKFFKNDNTVYIIAIVVLSIICILLLKKLLNL